VATLLEQFRNNLLEHARLVDYALPAGVITAIGLVSLVIWPHGVGPDVKYFLLIGAVLFTSLYCGLAPALFATVLSALGMAFFSLAPFLSLEVYSGPAHQRLMVFVIEGVLIAVLGAVVRRTSQTHVLPFKDLTYLAAPLSVGTAMVLKVLLFPQLARETPFVFNYAAISVSAWLGGIASGGVATLACALLTRYYFLAPVHSLLIADETEAIRLSLFVSEGVLLSLLTGSHVKLRRAILDLTSRSRAYLEMIIRWREDLEATRRVSRDILWEWNLESGEIQRLYGLKEPLSEVLPKRDVFGGWLGQMHAEDRKRVFELATRALAEGRTEFQYTYQVLGRDGIYFQLSDHAFVVRDAVRKPLRVIGRTAYVESRSRRRLRHLELSRFERMFKQSPIALLITDSSLNILASNTSASAVLLARAEELSNTGLLSLIDQPVRADAANRFASLFRSYRRSAHFESKLVRHDGQVFAATIGALRITGFLDDATGCLVSIDEAGPPSVIPG
jgi:PAS domain-containing protein